MVNVLERAGQWAQCRQLGVAAAIACAACGDVAVQDPPGADDASIDEDASSPEDAGQLGRCFEEHLLEAIAINQQRRPMYAALTGGRSVPVSDRLIESEQTSLHFAAPLDDAAEALHSLGLSIVCDEFISMSETPAFADRFAFDPEPLEAFVEVDGWKLGEQFEATFADAGFAGVSELATQTLTALEHPRAYHCMIRHMLESIRRIANFAPIHEGRAQELGAPSTLGLSEDMVRMHILSLGAAAGLDVQAAALQAEGVPILCQDVPSIPPGP